MKVYQLIPASHSSTLSYYDKIPRWYASRREAEKGLIQLWAEGKGISLYSPIIELDVVEEVKPFDGVILRSTVEKDADGRIQRIVKGSTVPVGYKETIKDLSNTKYTPGSSTIGFTYSDWVHLESASCAQDVAFALPTLSWMGRSSDTYFYCYVSSYSELDEDVAESLAKTEFEAYTRHLDHSLVSSSSGVDGTEKQQWAVIHCVISKNDTDFRIADVFWNTHPKFDSSIVEVERRDGLKVVASIPSLVQKNELPMAIDGVDSIHFFFRWDRKLSCDMRFLSIPSISDDDKMACMNAYIKFLMKAMEKGSEE